MRQSKGSGTKLGVSAAFILSLFPEETTVNSALCVTLDNVSLWFHGRADGGVGPTGSETGKVQIWPTGKDEQWVGQPLSFLAFGISFGLNLVRRFLG